MSGIRLGRGVVTGRIYAGALAPCGNKFYCSKTDVTEDVLLLAAESFIKYEQMFSKDIILLLDGKPKFKITVRDISNE